MTVEFITKEDLNQLKKELIQEITGLLTKNTASTKKWLRSVEVRKMLSISPGTLQNLRINGNLKYTKVGSIFYYDAADIAKMMSDNLTA
ncbi:MAG: helix-turn-helix domain-containing protein [Candidatus Pedobacter colombiensis]|uniref:Helix-turn-helix domain-containing protein n=1 Tax=Candidatus Pedobacter colombiensis TaxID=3121371 RepID=A0AAJ5WBK7_9SPHI|nr:helix-turn-helix domain-containing protein [Pedobacter sp.]WEK20459.1 MAG: helix-turn-helix domain-containing protein [Pedobacter sp.]